MRTIAQISDLHFGRHDPEVVEGLLAELLDPAPDLVVVSGDLTQRARRREFRQARAFLDRITAPVVAIPGNHDVPLYDVARRFLRPLARFRRYVSADPIPCYADAEIAVLGLNTARSLTLKNGRVSVEQMDAIRHAFGRPPGARFRVLVTHHPIVVAGDPDQEPVGRWRGALGAVAETGVRLLLSGHYHHAYVGSAATRLAAGGAILVVHAGTAVSRRTRRETNTYNRIRVDTDGMLSLEVRAWNIDGGGFKTERTAAYRLLGDHWAPA
jgi:3',5'-cyclic AMP phosphodiesterase CpdA